MILLKIVNKYFSSLILIQVLLFTSWAAISAAWASDHLMFPVPSSAKGPRHIYLQDSAGEQDYFSIRLAYPSTRVLEHYQTVLQAWVTCQPSRPEWQSFEDATGSQPRFLHQLIRHWISRDNKSLVTVALRYSSKGAKWRSEPDSDLQEVFVLKYLSLDAKVDVRLLGASCERN